MKLLLNCLQIWKISFVFCLLRLSGDLVSGEINIGIAAMTMTSERAAAIDFVAPYFDQSGISIVTRFPVKPKSLFKFMDGEQTNMNISNKLIDEHEGIKRIKQIFVVGKKS